MFISYYFFLFFVNDAMQMIDITFSLVCNELLLRVMGQLFVAQNYISTALTSGFGIFIMLCK